MVRSNAISHGSVQQTRIFAAALAAWLDRVLALYSVRIRPFDLRIARCWGQLSAALGNDSADLMISATALEHGLFVVTRNVADFVPTDVAPLNPFGSRGVSEAGGSMALWLCSALEARLSAFATDPANLYAWTI